MMNTEQEYDSQTNNIIGSSHSSTNTKTKTKIKQEDRHEVTLVFILFLTKRTVHTWSERKHTRENLSQLFPIFHENIRNAYRETLRRKKTSPVLPAPLTYQHKKAYT